MATEDDRPCYYPDGTEAPNTVPCSSDQNTACCGSGDICLTNGLCLSASHQPYHLSRGACTDSEWGYSCPGQCVDSDPSGGVALFTLKYEPTTYCCGTPISDGDSVVCPVGDKGGFAVDDGSMIFGRAGLFNDSTVEPTATETAAPGSSPTGATAPPADDSSSCHQTAIGAGVGVSLGVVALASILWAIWERRKRKDNKAISTQGDVFAPPPVKIHELPHNKSTPELDNTKNVPEMMGSEGQRP